MGSEYVYASFIRGTFDIILEKKSSLEKKMEGLRNEFLQMFRSAVTIKDIFLDPH